jgi:exodeoxyribonuclease VII small subunit
MAKTPTYRELQDQLDAVVAKLEDPSIDIDEATKAHEQGLKLINQLQAHLTEAENKISKAQADFTAAD